MQSFEIRGFIHHLKKTLIMIINFNLQHHGINKQKE